MEIGGSRVAVVILAVIALALFGNMTAVGLEMSRSETGFERQIEFEIQTAMKERHVPGVALVVVKNGTIVLSRGFGRADARLMRPIDPERTIFRAGSVSKLLTATAVMQLVEAGQIDLHADVNNYLRKFKVPPTFPRPVTTADLLTHTAGFAEYIHGQHVLEESEWQPLGDYLARRLPPRIRPAGEIISYNDHGFSLAGFLVQEISGMPYEDFIHKKIFLPLGMSRSSFAQRLPETLGRDLATGYKFTNERFEPYTLDYCEVTPAAGLYTTAHDIARFMIAHLHRGSFENVRILNEDAAAEMQRRHCAHHPELRGRAYGFSELPLNGQRAIFHDGAMPGFNARICLIPEKDTGFLLAWNSDDLRLKGDFTKSFFDYFFPFQQNPLGARPTAGRITPVKDLAGCYEEEAGLSTTCLRMGGMLMNHLPVVSTSRSTLKTLGSEFSEVKPLLFRDSDGYSLAFRYDQKEDRQYLYLGTGAMTKLPWYETPRALLAQLLFFTLVFLPLGLVWPVGLLARGTAFRACWQRLPPGRSLAAVVSFLFLFFLAAYVMLFLQIDHYWQIMRGEFPWTWLTKLLAVPLAGSMLTAGLLALTLRAWIGKLGSRGGWLCLTLISLSAALFVWLLNHWNLLGYKY